MTTIEGVLNELGKGRLFLKKPKKVKDGWKIFTKKGSKLYGDLVELICEVGEVSGKSKEANEIMDALDRVCFLEGPEY